MIYNWYLLFNRPDFEATELVSRTLKFFLEDVGNVEILVTQGNELAITYDGVFLPVGFNRENPYAISPYAVAEDFDGNIYLGIEVPA